MPDNIVKIRNNVFHIYESLGVYCTLVVGTEKALLIDTGFGFCNISSIVRNITSLPIIVLNTHGHTDHIQGNKHFEKIYIHKNDIKLLRMHSSLIAKVFIYLSSRKNLTASEKDRKSLYFQPNKQRISTIGEGELIDIGNNKLEIIHTPGHTKGSICVLDKENRILYSGDSFSSHVWLFFKESTSISTYVESINKVLLRIDDFDQILSSHSQVVFRTRLLENIKHCAENISLEESTVFDTKLAGKALLYKEGFRHITEQYGYQTFEEFILNFNNIQPKDFARIDFASIVYAKSKLNR